MQRIWVDQAKCLACRSCELACAVERDSITKTLPVAAHEADKPRARVTVAGRTGASFPLQCRHCQDAPCLQVCPSGAMQLDAASGAVLVDPNRCRSCFMCVLVCPFGCVVPVSGRPVVQKCDLCVHRESPACVQACPTGALIYADERGLAPVLAARRQRVADAASAIDPSAWAVSPKTCGEDESR